LKQIGIGVHNFHDTQNGVPPLQIGMLDTEGNYQYWSRVSTWGLLYPFIEQTALHEKLTEWQRRTDAATYGCVNNGSVDTLWWLKYLGEEDRNAFGSVPIYRCPSRRGNGPLFSQGTSTTLNDFMNFQGPQGDYAVIIMRNTGAVYENWNVGNKNHYERITGPFRVALWQNTGNFLTWLPRDSMAWWQDGSSNQLVAGEKHIPTHQLGKCTEIQKSGAELDDCSYLMSGHWKTLISARSFQVANSNTSLPITRGPSDPVSDPITVPTANGSCASENGAPECK
jgi:hypothetical protein